MNDAEQWRSVAKRNELNQILDLYHVLMTVTFSLYMKFAKNNYTLNLLFTSSQTNTIIKKVQQNKLNILTVTCH